MDKTLHHLATTAKAYAALLGSIVTALLGVLGPDDPAAHWLTIAAAVLTAVATWAIPNADQYQPQPDGPQDSAAS